MQKNVKKHENPTPEKILYFCILAVKTNEKGREKSEKILFFSEFSLNFL